MTLREWLLYHQREIHFNKCVWMGIPALKNPLDAWIYQEIIYEVKPDIIVEIGSFNGGSTLFLAQMLDLIGKGHVLSIDINRDNFQVQHEKIIPITGDSSSSDVVSKVSEWCLGKSVLIIQDGGHEKEQVLADLRAYSNCVTRGSYFIVEDSIVDFFEPGDGIGTLYEGPSKAIEEFLAENSNFVIDSECERYLLTYNPKGFLKRVS